MASKDIKYLTSFWDCTECGERNISSVVFDNEGNIVAPRLLCPQCFFPKDESEALYTTDESVEITDPKDIKALTAQALWVCQASDCEAINQKGVHQNCHSCGTWPEIGESGKEILVSPTNLQVEAYRTKASMGDTSRFANPVIPRSFKKDKKLFEEKYHGSSNTRNISVDFSGSKLGSFAREQGFYFGKFKKAEKIVKAFLVAILILVFGAGAFKFIQWGTTPHLVSAQVTHKQAKTSVSIDHKVAKEGSGWETSIPYLAYDIQTSRRKNGTKKVSYSPPKYETKHRKKLVGQKKVGEDCRTSQKADGALVKSVKTCTDRMENQYEQEPYQVEVKKTVDTYGTWATWKVNEWEHYKTIRESSNEEVPVVLVPPSYKNSQQYKINSPISTCMVGLDVLESEVEVPSTTTADCSHFKEYVVGENLDFSWTRFGGITGLRD